MTLPFIQKDDEIIGLQVDEGETVARSRVRLDYQCNETGRAERRWLDVAISLQSRTRRRLVNRAILRGAWQALHDHYNGDDPLHSNIFVEDELAEEDNAQLYRNLVMLEMQDGADHLQTRLLGWVPPVKIVETTQSKAA